MEVESNARHPYNQSQCHNSLISVPNCNANSINKHLSTKIVNVDENVRAENNQQRRSGRRGTEKNLDDKMTGVILPVETITHMKVCQQM